MLFRRRLTGLKKEVGAAGYCSSEIRSFCPFWMDWPSERLFNLRSFSTVIPYFLLIPYRISPFWTKWCRLWTVTTGFGGVSFNLDFDSFLFCEILYISIFFILYTKNFSPPPKSFHPLPSSNNHPRSESKDDFSPSVEATHDESCCVETKLRDLTPRTEYRLSLFLPAEHDNTHALALKQRDKCYCAEISSETPSRPALLRRQR